MAKRLQPKSRQRIENQLRSLTENQIRDIIIEENPTRIKEILNKPTIADNTAIAYRNNIKSALIRFNEQNSQNLQTQAIIQRIEIEDKAEIFSEISVLEAENRRLRIENAEQREVIQRLRQDLSRQIQSGRYNEREIADIQANYSQNELIERINSDQRTLSGLSRNENLADISIQDLNLRDLSFLYLRINERIEDLAEIQQNNQYQADWSKALSKANRLIDELNELTDSDESIDENLELNELYDLIENIQSRIRNTKEKIKQDKRKQDLIYSIEKIDEKLKKKEVYSAIPNNLNFLSIVDLIILKDELQTKYSNLDKINKEKREREIAIDETIALIESFNSDIVRYGGKPIIIEKEDRTNLEELIELKNIAEIEFQDRYEFFKIDLVSDIEKKVEKLKNFGFSIEIDSDELVKESESELSDRIEYYNSKIDEYSLNQKDKIAEIKKKQAELYSLGQMAPSISIQKLNKKTIEELDEIIGTINQDISKREISMRNEIEVQIPKLVSEINDFVQYFEKEGIAYPKIENVQDLLLLDKYQLKMIKYNLKTIADKHSSKFNLDIGRTIVSNRQTLGQNIITRMDIPKTSLSDYLSSGNTDSVLAELYSDFNKIAVKVNFKDQNNRSFSSYKEIDIRGMQLNEIYEAIELEIEAEEGKYKEGSSGSYTCYGFGRS